MDQFFRRQDIDYSLAVLVGLDEVVDAERRLSEEFFSTLFIEGGAWLCIFAFEE